MMILYFALFKTLLHCVSTAECFHVGVIGSSFLPRGVLSVLIVIIHVFIIV